MKSISFLLLAAMSLQLSACVEDQYHTMSTGHHHRHHSYHTSSSYQRSNAGSYVSGTSSDGYEAQSTGNGSYVTGEYSGR